MNLAQAPVFARAALIEGQGALARSVALGLIKANPDDFAAHAILSAAEAMLGDAEAAARAGRAAYRLGNTATERYEASVLTAGALASTEAYGRAQFWLRRAAELAPNEAARAGVERQFRLVRRVNPLSVNLSFGIAPTSNVNNGARSETVDLFGLPFQLSGAAQALSGVEASVGVSLRYRLSESPTQMTEAGLLLFNRSFWLADSAKAQAPDVRGSDFAFQVAEVSLRHRFRPEGAVATWSVASTLGRNWYGGAALTDYARLSLGRTQALSPVTTFDLDLTGEVRDRIDDDARSSESLEVVGRVDRRLGSGDRFGLHFGLRETRSSSQSIDHTAVLAGARYALAEPVAGVQLSATFDAEWRDYGADALAPAGRKDVQASLGVTAKFRQVEYFGFSPTLDVRARGVFSDVVVYDTREIGVRLGITSNF